VLKMVGATLQDRAGPGGAAGRQRRRGQGRCVAAALSSAGERQSRGLRRVLPALAAAARHPAAHSHSRARCLAGWWPVLPLPGRPAASARPRGCGPGSAPSMIHGSEEMSLAKKGPKVYIGLFFRFCATTWPGGFYLPK
jgi:hypothetical protein